LLQHPFDDGALARAVAPWDASFNDVDGLFREAKVSEALCEAGDNFRKPRLFRRAEYANPSPARLARC
jgi:hypothetical protein